MKVHDLIIIGAGAAGLSAAIYAQRAMLDTIVIEKNSFSGGQIVNTYEVDNYPGLSNKNGFDLAMEFREHADKLGTKFLEAEVKRIIDHTQYKEVVLAEQDNIYTKAIIIATGAKHRMLGVEGEEELSGVGVSYCATCDGAFFRGKTVAVVGGGDVALEDAIFLARGCKKVYLIHRRNEFRGAKILQDAVEKLENVTVLWDTVVKQIEGKERVEGIVIQNVLSEEVKELELEGVFVAVGIRPVGEVAADIVEVDEAGYIVANECGETSVEGIYVAGDIRTKQLRQVVTAAADGANCVFSVERYLTKIEA